MTCEPIYTVKRWSMPRSFKVYKEIVGGADLFDQFVAIYSARITSKMCWWVLFARSINAAVVNRWKLFRTFHGYRMLLLQFVRQIVQQSLVVHGIKVYHLFSTLELQETAFVRSSHRRCSVKKGVLKNSQNSQENTFTKVIFLK